MGVRIDVLLWAQRVVARAPDTLPHVMLEVPPDATLEQAQEAFHKIARTSHPDLHRASLTPDELENVTTAYARVAAAYQELRAKRMGTQRMRTLRQEPPPPPGPGRTPTTGQMPAQSPSRTPSDKIPAQSASGTPTESQALPGGPGPMNSKALLYYRKAELCLRKGDLKTAVLNIKMAIAGDPQSTFLRTALAEIESELAKK